MKFIHSVLCIMTLSFATAQTLKVVYEDISLRGNLINQSVLYASNDRGQFIRDTEAKKFKIGEYDAETDAHYYVHDYYPKTKMAQEIAYFKKQQFFAEWEIEDSWTITDETDVVLGYKVIKAYKHDASTDGKLFAWFAPTIPLPYGPFRDNGLPGLILKVSFEKKNTVTTAISIDKVSIQEFVNLSDDAIKISRDAIIAQDQGQMKKAIREK